MGPVVNRAAAAVYKPEPVSPDVESRERLGVAVGAALLVGGLFLVIAVLPAEYGIDPLGFGARMGLRALNDTQRAIDAYTATPGNAGGAPLIVPQDHGYQSETVEFKIAPRD